jgi:hypothetical protein
MAKIEGKEKKDEGWDKDGHLLLADGRCFSFEPLFEQKDDFRGRRLIAVARVELKGAGWEIDGQPLEPQLVDSLSHGVHAPLTDETFRLWPLQATLRELDLKEAVTVKAAAWFDFPDDVGGTDSPVLLRSFHELKPNPELERRGELARQEAKNLAAKRQILAQEAKLRRQSGSEPVTIEQCCAELGRPDKPLTSRGLRELCKRHSFEKPPPGAENSTNSRGFTRSDKSATEGSSQIATVLAEVKSDAHK